MTGSRYLINSVALAMVILGGAYPADAQVTSLGTTTSGPAAAVVGASRSAVAYDDKHDVFLHVWEDQGIIAGRFIGFDGTPRGTAFTIAPAVTLDPKVVYSKGAADDVFCVVVSQRQPNGSLPNTVVVSFVRFTGTGPTGGTAVGAPTTLSTSDSPGADAVFNPNLRRFLLAWGAPTGVALRHFDGSGSPADSVVTIAAEVESARPFVRVKGIKLAYDWQQRKYLLRAEELRLTSPTGTFISESDVVRVLDESTRLPIGPAATLANTTLTSQGIDLTFLPEAAGFLTSVTRLFTPEISGTFVPTANPAAAGAPYTLLSGHSDQHGAIDYDALSRTVLVADLSFDSGPAPFQIGGALLDGSGQPVTGWTALTTNTTSFGPPFVLATNDGQFVVSYIVGGNAILERFSVPLASPAGPRFSNVSGHVDAPVNGATVGPSFLFGGWALDFGASTGTGVDAVHAWAFPSNGSPAIFLGDDQLFHARGDLASLYGPHFASSGFDINVSGLAAGTYTLVAYARSTVSGAFAQVDALTVTVAAQPFMSLDLPSDGATVGPSFTVGGWALDLSAASGTTGVDAVHVWAFPTSGAAAIFVGADYGGARPDVAAAFGPAFTNSGFHLDVTNFPPGSYYVVAYAHDTVTGTFSIQRGASVTVAAAPPM